MKEKKARSSTRSFLPKSQHCLFCTSLMYCWLTIVALALASCSALPTSADNPTPTPIFPSPTADTTANISGAAPTAMCSEAVQQIHQNQIGLIKLYRQRVGTPQIPTNSVTTIMFYPRSARLSDGTYNAFSGIDIDPLDYPDRDCYPQLTRAVQQVNAHLSKDQQVEISWLYSVS